MKKEDMFIVLIVLEIILISILIFFKQWNIFSFFAGEFVAGIFLNNEIGGKHE